MLRVVPLTDWGLWARIVAVAASLIVAVELHKLLRRPRRARPQPESTRQVRLSAAEPRA